MCSKFVKAKTMAQRVRICNIKIFRRKKYYIIIFHYDLNPKNNIIKNRSKGNGTRIKVLSQHPDMSVWRTADDHQWNQSSSNQRQLLQSTVKRLCNTWSRAFTFELSYRTYIYIERAPFHFFIRWTESVCKISIQIQKPRYDGKICYSSIDWNKCHDLNLTTKIVIIKMFSRCLWSLYSTK